MAKGKHTHQHFTGKLKFTAYRAMMIPLLRSLDHTAMVKLAQATSKCRRLLALPLLELEARPQHSVWQRPQAARQLLLLLVVPPLHRPTMPTFAAAGVDDSRRTTPSRHHLRHLHWLARCWRAPCASGHGCPQEHTQQQLLHLIPNSSGDVFESQSACLVQKNGYE